MRNINWYAHLSLMAVAIFYGANYAIAKIALDQSYIGPKAFILLRVLAACLFFWILSARQPKTSFAKKDWMRLCLCGLFGVSVNQLFFFTGLKYTTPIHASLIMTLGPAIVVISAFFLLGELITWRKLMGILIGGTGAVLLILKGRTLSYFPHQLFGDLLVFVNILSFGLYLVLVKPLVAQYDTLQVMKWIFTIGLVIVIPFGSAELAATEWAAFTPVVWFSVGYVLLFATCLTYGLNAYALQMVSPAIVSIYIYLQPLVATAISIALGIEYLNFYNVLAGLMIFLGVFFISFPVQLFSKISFKRIRQK